METRQPPEIEIEPPDDTKERLIQLWNDWGSTLLTAILLVVAVIFAVKVYNARKFESAERAWTEMAAESSPQAFARLAEDHPGTGIARLAYIRAGDLFLEDARPRLDPETGELSPNPTAAESLSRARAAYNVVVADPKADLIFKLNAKLGLAAVEESSNAYDKSAALYREIAAEASGRFPMIAERARAALKLVDTLDEPLVYAQPVRQTPVLPGGMQLPIMPVVPVAPAPEQPQ